MNDDIKKQLMSQAVQEIVKRHMTELNAIEALIVTIEIPMFLQHLNELPNMKSRLALLSIIKEYAEIAAGLDKK